MNDEYKEFTFGWLIFTIVVPIHVFITYLYLAQIGDRPMPGVAYLTISIALFITYVLFYGLTTTVMSDKIVVSFGIGLIKIKIKLDDVRQVETVTSPWYYGWGIRIIPNGMLYNISGTAGVELRFNGRKSITRIGSPDPVRLKSAIEKRLRE